MQTYQFTAVIQAASAKGGAFVAFPYDLPTEFGRGRLKVHATFDGQPYNGSIVNMGVKNPDGSICYVLGILKAIRQTLGKDIGDTVQVVVTPR